MPIVEVVAVGFEQSVVVVERRVVLRVDVRGLGVDAGGHGRETAREASFAFEDFLNDADEVLDLLIGGALDL